MFHIAGPQRIGYGLGGGPFLPKGIHLSPVLPESVTYMGAAGIAGHPDPADDIPLSHKIAPLDLLVAHMEALGAVHAIVLDLYIFSIAPLASGFGDGPVRRGHDGGPDIGGIVRALMGSYLIAII